VLIAALGEENYPVGRSCCYPVELQPAINKADCFRLRCIPNSAINAFVMNFLNTLKARGQVRRFEQGVTRKRINMGNLRRILISLPNLAEQKKVVRALSVAAAWIEMAEQHKNKLQLKKHGLMQDLLTGRVRVKVAEPADGTA
jgi:type I restriction enzyme S subunit